MKYATALGLLAGLAAAPALAAPIVGNISTVGIDTFDATTIHFVGPGSIGPGTATGSFVPAFSLGCIGCLTLTDFTYSTLGAHAPVTVYSGGVFGKVTSLIITNIVSATNTGGFLDVKATGYATLTGFDPTDGTFLFDSQGDGTLKTTFSTLTVIPAAVPEPASMAVLGAGLLGLGALRRRRNG